MPESSISDVIAELLEAEKEAFAMAATAESEADKRRAAARTEAVEKYKTRYENLFAELDSSFEKQKAIIADDYEKEMESYKTRLRSIPMHTEEVNALLEKYLWRNATDG